MTVLIVIAVFTAHLLCMHLASAGPLLCIWCDMRARWGGQGDAEQTGQRLGRLSIWSLFVGSGLGLALGWYLAIAAGRDYSGVIYRLGSRVWWGVWELLFYVLVMLVYLSWWRQSARKRRWQFALHHSLAVVAATNLLYHFPPLWSIAGRLWDQPPENAAAIDSAAFRALMLEGEVLAKSAHFWVASMATAGMAVLGLAAWNRAEHGTPAMALTGARVALAAFLTEMPVGMWLIAVLPAVQQQRLLGGSGSVTACMVVGVILALALAQQLATLSFGDFTRRRAQVATVLYVFVVGLMTATLVLQNRLFG